MRISAAVTMGDGSQQIFYAQQVFYSGYYHYEFKMYSPTANEHTAITLNGDPTGNYGFACLASSADGGALFGVDGER